MDTPGKRIKKLRDEMGLSQEELAKKLQKTSKQTISNWENDRGEPTLPDYRKLAELFQTTVSFLLCETEDNTSRKPDTVTIPVQEYLDLQRYALQKEREEKENLKRQLEELKNL